MESQEKLQLVAQLVTEALHERILKRADRTVEKILGKLKRLSRSEMKMELNNPGCFPVFISMLPFSVF